MSLRDQRQGEGKGLDFQSLPLLLANNYQRLILMPTEQCNLRCTYCYEDFEHRRMERTVVEGLKRYISRRVPELDALRIDWFGGEPLLAREIVEEIQGHARREAEAHGVHLWGAMTTNAVLLDPETFRRLVALGITRYQISLDGPQALHDRKRVTGGGKGTYATIRGHLEGFRQLEEDFEVMLRVHVDRSNLEAMPAFMDELGEAFGGDERFSLYVRELARLGGSNDGNIDILDRNEEEEILEGLRGRAEACGLKRDGTAPKPCYAAAANAWVVRSTGDLAKCTVALRDAENRVGRILETGELEIDEERALPWLRGFETGDEKDFLCPANGLAASRRQKKPSLLPILNNHGPEALSLAG